MTHKHKLFAWISKNKLGNDFVTLKNAANKASGHYNQRPRDRNEKAILIKFLEYKFQQRKETTW